MSTHYPDDASRTLAVEVEALLSRVGAAEPTAWVRLLRASIDALAAYEALDPASPERSAAAALLADLFDPIPFSPREEPREVLRRLVRSLDDERSETFRRALFILLDQLLNSRDLEAAGAVLRFLADANVSAGEALAFHAFRRFDSLLGGPSALSGLSPSFVSLAGARSGVAAISMLDRLRVGHNVTSAAIYACLRSVALSDPSWLAATLHSNIDALLVVRNPQNPVELRFLLRDLIHRAGATVVVSAIGQFDLHQTPVLYRAAFGGGAAAPLKLVKVIGADPQSQEVYVDADGQRVSLHYLRRNGEGFEAIPRLRDVTGAQFYIFVPTASPAVFPPPPAWFRQAREAGAKETITISRARRTRSAGDAEEPVPLVTDYIKGFPGFRAIIA